MRLIDLNDPVQTLEIKEEIEKHLINTQVISEPMCLSDFINYLDLKNNIFVKDDTIIPFKIYENKLLISVVDKSSLSMLDNILKQIDYNLDVLTEISISEVYENKLDNYNFYFIINSKYKVIEK